MCVVWASQCHTPTIWEKFHSTHDSGDFGVCLLLGLSHQLR